MLGVAQPEIVVAVRYGDLYALATKTLPLVFCVALVDPFHTVVWSGRHRVVLWVPSTLKVQREIHAFAAATGRAFATLRRQLIRCAGPALLHVIGCQCQAKASTIQ